MDTFDENDNGFKLERTVTCENGIDRTSSVMSTLSKTESNIVQKFSHVDWSTIEQTLQPSEINVLTMLGDYMEYLINYNEEDNTCENVLSQYISNTTIKYKIIGEKIYIQYIRQKISDVLNLESIKFQNDDNKSSNKKHTKKGVTKEDVIFRTLEQSIIKFIEILSIKKAKSDITNTITSNILYFNVLEYIGITLMFQLNECMNVLKKKFNIDMYKIALSSYVSMKLFINNCNEISGSSYLYPDKTINISSTLINDMIFMVETFQSYEFEYNKSAIKCGHINDIYKYTPHLLIQCDHSNIIPGTQLKPRKSQSDTMKKFIDYFNDGVLIISKAMIGSGKTTLIIPIANYVQYKRKQDNYKKLQLVFCCNILSVKLQAATLCFNMGIPFGMAHVTIEYYDADNKIVYDKTKAKYNKNVVKIINNFNCKHDNNRIVIIGSPDAIELLFQTTDDYTENYVLFLDEPTVGLDSKKAINSPLMLSNVNLLINLPKRSILSSATMPYLQSQSMQQMIENLRCRYMSIYIDMIIGDEIFIGCNVATNSGNIVTPHNKCITFPDLQKIVEFVNSNPFMGRMYTYDIFKTLIDKSQLNDLIDIFNDIKHVNANSIKKQSLKLLESLNEELTIYCCENIKSDSELTINNIGTSEAYKFPNMTLIAVENNIVNTTISMFKDLLNTLPDYILMINKYDHDVMKYEENKLKHEDSRKKTSNKKSKNHDDEKQSKLDRDRELEDNIGEPPNIKFPNTGKINSNEHIKYYSKDAQIKPRLSFILEEIKYDFTVIDDVKLLLMCGVGIYSPSLFDSRYTNEVIRLASKGSLAFVISDYDICYGTNYPFNTVIITEDFANNHSMNTLFQLMGRAGRVGRSWTANAILPDKLYDVFIDYMKTPDKYDIEEKNLYKLMN